MQSPMGPEILAPAGGFLTSLTFSIIIMIIRKCLSPLELGEKFRICRNYPDISHPKPVSESFWAKTKFRLTLDGQIA